MDLRELGSKEEISNRILEFRYYGEFEKAIELANVAACRHPYDYFYPKVIADMYLQQGNYIKALEFYALFLKKVGKAEGVFNDFARKYNKILVYADKEEIEKFNSEIIQEKEKINLWTFKKFVELSGAKIYSPLAQDLVNVLINSTSVQILNDKIKALEEIDTDELKRVLDEYVLNRQTDEKLMFNVDKHCMSVYERLGKYDETLDLGVRLIRIRTLDEVVIRSIFRTCRKKGNYEVADKIFDDNPEIEKRNTFNVLYELVYYYDSKGEKEKVIEALDKIEKNFVDSIPINRTARNFYAQFGMIEDANRLDEHIKNLQQKTKRVKFNYRFDEALFESQEGMWARIRILESELEHQKQLAAISELTTGISHELGQPITNIRFTVQYYQKMFEKDIEREKLFKAFASILEETERMGGLIKRLAPLTSSKSVTAKFDLVERIRKRIETEDARIKNAKINVKVRVKNSVYLEADPVKVDQIINNLLLNSIYALENYAASKKSKEIHICVSQDNDMINIVFMDNGPGIPIANRSKIFDPFYSTKPTGEGEGLGLFIIWNLLKSMGGNIALDSTYKQGARFKIYIPKRR